MTTTKHERKWWKEAVIYQIYPSTFLDTNGDGIGDLPGITSKLDHLVSLGATVLWLSPHYASPQVDMGYDISDFQAIHPPYGSLEDCQTLIDEAHRRGLKVIFDLVINHVSDKHKWFEEARSSRDSRKRDWFFWKPPRWGPDGKRMPPNNWRSQFTVPAWTWDEKTGEYYLHVYAPQMPDLNWENADCRRAIYDSAIRFWLDRGIDGFRIDTVNKYSKNISFPDAPITEPGEETQPAMEHYTNGPRMREFLLEMNDVFDGYDIMTVGELPNTPLASDVLGYVSAEKRQLNMVFNFDAVNLGKKNRLLAIPFTTADFTRELSRWQTFVRGTDAWTTVFLENHDQSRSISRFGDDSTEEMRQRSGKLLALVLSTMTGTLFLYQGQEIGMVNAPRSWPASEYKDIRSVNFYAQVRERAAASGDIGALDRALDGMQKVARDNARLPMQWNAGPNAGFCAEGTTPWMRVHDGFATVNVEKQDREGPRSVLGFWKTLLGLRKGPYVDLWVYGDFEAVETGVEGVFAFVKRLNGEGERQRARQGEQEHERQGEQEHERAPEQDEEGEEMSSPFSLTIANLTPHAHPLPDSVRDILRKARQRQMRLVVCNVLDSERSERKCEREREGGRGGEERVKVDGQGERGVEGREGGGDKGEGAGGDEILEAWEGRVYVSEA